MDPNLTNPIVLNTSINATLFQPPQPWWASSTLITAGVTLLAAYLGQRWARSSEKERDFLKARRRAYYEYVEVFSEAARIKDWTPLLISERLSILWKVAVGAGKYGNIGNLDFVARLNNLLRIEEDPSLAYDLRSQLRVFSYDCKVKENVDRIDCIEIDSFYGFIELIEALLRIDPAQIKIGYLLECGQAYFPVFRNILLNETRKAPRWALWRKEREFVLYKSPPWDEDVKAKRWWQFWK